MAALAPTADMIAHVRALPQAWSHLSDMSKQVFLECPSNLAFETGLVHGPLGGMGTWWKCKSQGSWEGQILLSHTVQPGETEAALQSRALLLDEKLLFS